MVGWSRGAFQRFFYVNKLLNQSKRVYSRVAASMINMPALPAYMALMEEAAPATSAGSLVGDVTVPAVVDAPLVTETGLEV